MIYWDLYPKELRDLFTESFTVGLKEPGKRVTENKWLETLANMMSGILICPKCEAETFYDSTKEQLGAAHTCWNCDKVLHIPSKIIINKNTILIMEDTKLYSHHINNDFNMKTVVGKVLINPSNPSIWGIKNMTKTNWTYVQGDGTQIPVASGKAATIAKNVKIDFGFGF